MSTQEQIAVTYDVSNEFFRLWLDAGMSYSCAVFAKGDSLEQAQQRKLAWICEAAHIEAGSRVLDIGCGWGAALQFMVSRLGVTEAVGLTLSEAQFDEVLTRKLPGVSVECVSFREYRPARLFDAVVSIGMFEHVATPEQARAGEHVAVYRDYFRRVWSWTRPGAWFGLQSIVGLRIPRDRRFLRELGWGTYTIFPGAITPRLEAIASAVSPYWEIVEVQMRREHYARTAAEWLRRLRSQERVIRERWGDARFEEYQRYLSGSVTAFQDGYQSLAQLALRRMDPHPKRDSEEDGNERR